MSTAIAAVISPSIYKNNNNSNTSIAVAPPSRRAPSPPVGGYPPSRPLSLHNPTPAISSADSRSNTPQAPSPQAMSALRYRGTRLDPQIDSLKKSLGQAATATHQILSHLPPETITNHEKETRNQFKKMTDAFAAFIASSPELHQSIKAVLENLPRETWKDQVPRQAHALLSKGRNAVAGPWGKSVGWGLAAVAAKNAAWYGHTFIPEHFGSWNIKSEAAEATLKIVLSWVIARGEYSLLTKANSTAERAGIPLTRLRGVMEQTDMATFMAYIGAMYALKKMERPQVEHCVGLGLQMGAAWLLNQQNKPFEKSIQKASALLPRKKRPATTATTEEKDLEKNLPSNAPAAVSPKKTSTQTSIKEINALMAHLQLQGPLIKQLEKFKSELKEFQELVAQNHIANLDIERPLNDCFKLLETIGSDETAFKASLQAIKNELQKIKNHEPKTTAKIFAGVYALIQVACAIGIGATWHNKEQRPLVFLLAILSTGFKLPAWYGPTLLSSTTSDSKKSWMGWGIASFEFIFLTLATIFAEKSHIHLAKVRSVLTAADLTWTAASMAAVKGEDLKSWNWAALPLAALGATIANLP
jgi:uncharacterized protein (DUF486 family)